MKRLTFWLVASWLTYPLSKVGITRPCGIASDRYTRTLMDLCNVR